MVPAHIQCHQVRYCTRIHALGWSHCFEMHLLVSIIEERNHKRPECHIIYNPQKLKDRHPAFNTQACEQTFVWLGRFHKILSSMPKVHNHFFIHRLVKRRNAYNTQCYNKGKKPLLPNVNNDLCISSLSL